MADNLGARNIGVKEASSDWIMFLDSDDYYDLRAVEYLVDLRDKYDVDLVVTSIVEVRDHKINSIGESFSLENSKKLDKDEALVQMFYGNSIGTSPGGKTL